MSREFEIGIQLHLPTFRHLTLRDFVDFARDAHAGGISQLWVTDNLRSRNQFVVLTASRQRSDQAGTAVLHYFRNPVDVADPVPPSLNLWTAGVRRACLRHATRRRVVKPVSMLRGQRVMRRSWRGAVKFNDYPAVSYFNPCPKHVSAEPAQVAGIAVRRQRTQGAGDGAPWTASSSAGHFSRSRMGHMAALHVADAAARRRLRSEVAEIKPRWQDDARHGV
jgi:hypothetical protein